MKHGCTMIFLAACHLAACTLPPPPDAAKECPWALQRGIRGDGITPCWIGATQDRTAEFLRANALTATCTGDIYATCSGVTKMGQPVKFKCKGDGCEWIPPWLW